MKLDKQWDDLPFRTLYNVVWMGWCESKIRVVPAQQRLFFSTPSHCSHWGFLPDSWQVLLLTECRALYHSSLPYDFLHFSVPVLRVSERCLNHCHFSEKQHDYGLSSDNVSLRCCPSTRQESLCHPKNLLILVNVILRDLFFEIFWNGNIRRVVNDLWNVAHYSHPEYPDSLPYWTPLKRRDNHAIMKVADFEDNKNE